MTATPGIESLMSFLEYAPDPAIVADAEDRIVVVNHSAESLFGYRRLELVGRNLHDLVPTLPPHETPIPDPGAEDHTIVARHRDGRSMRLSVSYRAVPLDHKLLTAAYFRPLEAAATPGGAALDHVPVAISRFDRDGRLLYANVASHGVLGGESARFAGRLPTEFGLPAQAGQGWLDAVRETVSSNGPRRFGLSIEMGGGTRWFGATAVPEPDHSGAVATVLVIIQDVTALHRTRADFESAELRFRRLTEGSHDLISQHAPDASFVFASRAATTIMQRSPDSLVGISVAEVVHEEDREKVVGLISRAARGETDPLTTFRLIRPDGSTLWCEMTAQAPHGGGLVTCITRDITERIKTEEILRAASRMEATATLAAGVAHDFNNLMTSILGNAELLLTDPDFPDAPSRLNQVAESAKRGGALAQQLLAYARGGKYQTQTVSVNDVVKQALHLQKHAMPPRIQLEADLDPDSPSIEADPVQIGQVVTNLCINATEATPGVGRVTIRTRRVTLSTEQVAGKPGLRPGPAVMIQVADSGTGIEASALPRIFEPFFSTKFQGRGLGLAAAYGIVKNHKGYIGVDSAVGRGTTFTIHFPAVTSLPARPVAQPEPFPTGDETLLLVDDDEAVIDVTKSILERLRYRVLIARHGIEAVEVARAYQGEIHLVILDLGMPLAGGAEAFPFLKAVRPDMRVMISSGYEMNDVVQGLLSAGADAFLQKPYRVSALARGLRQVLERKVVGARLEN